MGGKRLKCCPAHWEAFNRANRRAADRHCPCRGECGCPRKTPEVTVSEPVIESIARLELKPGEILVVRVPDRYPMDALHRMEEWVKARIPEGCSAMVLTDDMKLEVVSPS